MFITNISNYIYIIKYMICKCCFIFTSPKLMLFDKYLCDKLSVISL